MIHQDIHSTRHLKVSGGTTKTLANVSSRSFRLSYEVGPLWTRLLQLIPQMLDQITIWGIWRSNKHLELFKKFLKLFMNFFFSVAGCMILLKVDSSIRYTVVRKGFTWCETMFRFSRWYMFPSSLEHL